MYAIINDRGHQYKVREGDLLRVDMGVEEVVHQGDRAIDELLHLLEAAAHHDADVVGAEPA